MATEPAQKWRIITIFPEFFSTPLGCGLMQKALEKNILEISFINPRDFSSLPHRHVDDRPYGGGAGMVMRVEPLARALRSIENPGRIILLTPRGRPFNQELARELAAGKNTTLVCGRYEGVDERLEKLFPIEKICLGPYVLNGGETAALAVLEACARLLPGFMGKMESAEEESFSASLLEYPQYTRPEIYEGIRVPEVLLSGDHGAVDAWRRGESLATTIRYLPGLLDSAALGQEDTRRLGALPRKRHGPNLSFCLIHHPVILERGKIGTSSLTNLDIHDIARISRSYGLGPFYVATPLRDQQEMLEEILRHWIRGPGGLSNPDRKRALELVRPVESLARAREEIVRRCGREPFVAASSAAWPGRRLADKILNTAEARRICAQQPFLLCLGTAKGLAPELLADCDGILRPIRFLSENHLSVRAAAAILADRILGDYC